MARNVRFKIFKKYVGWVGGGGSAIKRGGLYELCYLSVISRHFKIFCKGAHKYYMTKNIGFSHCIYVLGIALAICYYLH